MQIVLLAAGAGTRYAGYSDVPKPFIQINGRAMWEHALDGWLQYGTPTLVIQRSHLPHYVAPEFPINLVLLDGLTDGAAETAYLACENLPPEEGVCFIDSDGFIQHTGWIGEGGGCFVDTRSAPVHSYVRLDPEGYIIEIREKEVISDIANTGHYWWHSVSLFRETFEFARAHNMRTKNEYYMAPMYDIAIQQGWKFTTHRVDRWVCLGVPADLINHLAIEHDGTDPHVGIGPQ